MRVRAIKFRDREFDNLWYAEVLDRWEYSDFLNDESWRKEWISFNCLCYDAATDTVFAGLTSFDADIFWGWNRKERSWVDTGCARIRERYDAKFHRSLVRDSRDGCLYAAPALLHDIDRFWEAPGATIIRYNPVSREIARLAIPMPHVYIQSLVLDESRDTLYAQTFTPENLISYNLNTCESRWIGPTGSGMSFGQSENIVLDDAACLWGTWNVTRAWQNDPGPDSHRFFKYDPHTGKINYMDKGLPRADGSYGYERPEAFFNFGTGCLYASGGDGALYRLDTKTANAQFLFQANDSKGRSRLSSMCLAPGGYAYGVIGRDGECWLLQFDPQKETYTIRGALKDTETGITCWQAHDICATPDGILYAAENDNPRRSGYLWEIEL